MTTQPKREPLKAGDRIKVLGYARQLDGVVHSPGEIVRSRAFDGARVTVKDEYFATVTFEAFGCVWEVYKTACRRLIPKRPRRRVWLYLNPFAPKPENPFHQEVDVSWQGIPPGHSAGGYYVEFVEVRSGRKRGAENA